MDSKLLDQLAAVINSRLEDQEIYRAEGTGENAAALLSRKTWGAKRARLEHGAGENGGWSEIDPEIIPADELPVSDDDRKEDIFRAKALIAGLKERFSGKTGDREKSRSCGSRADLKPLLISKIKGELSRLALALSSEHGSKGIKAIAGIEADGHNDLESIRSLASTLARLDYPVHKPHNPPGSGSFYPRIGDEARIFAELSNRVARLEEVIGMTNAGHLGLPNSPLSGAPNLEGRSNILEFVDELSKRVERLSENTGPAQGSRGASEPEDKCDEGPMEDNSDTALLLRRLDAAERLMPKIVTRLRGIRMLDSEVYSYSNLISFVSQRQAAADAKIREIHELLDAATSTHKHNMSVISKNIEHLINSINNISTANGADKVE